MKTVMPLILLIFLSGCLPKAMKEAHNQEGIILANYSQQSNELFEATVKDFENDVKLKYDANEGWMIERATDENGNIPIEKLNEIRNRRKQTEEIDAEQFAQLRLKWKENQRNFEAAMELHEAVQAWLNMTGLF